MSKSKSLCLRSPEVLRLDSHGECLWVRAVKFHKPFERHASWPIMELARDGMPIFWGATPSQGMRDCLNYDHGMPCPFGAVGDVVCGKESFQIGHETGGSPRRFTFLRETGKTDRDGIVFYRADRHNQVPCWRPASMMPAWASRFPSLRIARVECRMVSTITEEEAVAAGVRHKIVPCVLSEEEQKDLDGALDGLLRFGYSAIVGTLRTIIDRLSRQKAVPWRKIRRVEKSGYYFWGSASEVHWGFLNTCNEASEPVYHLSFDDVLATLPKGDATSK